MGASLQVGLATGDSFVGPSHLTFPIKGDGFRTFPVREFLKGEGYARPAPGEAQAACGMMSAQRFSKTSRSSFRPRWILERTVPTVVFCASAISE